MGKSVRIKHSVPVHCPVFLKHVVQMLVKFISSGMAQFSCSEASHIWLVDTQFDNVNEKISIAVTAVLAALVHPKEEALKVSTKQKVPASCAGPEGVFWPEIIKSAKGFSSSFLSFPSEMVVNLFVLAEK